MLPFSQGFYNASTLSHGHLSPCGPQRETGIINAETTLGFLFVMKCWLVQVIHACWICIPYMSMAAKFRNLWTSFFAISRITWSSTSFAWWSHMIQGWQRPFLSLFYAILISQHKGQQITNQNVHNFGGEEIGGNNRSIHIMFDQTCLDLFWLHSNFLK